MKVLVLKTSSLGDIIHTLPALSDAHAMIPSIRFDWLVEEDFADIPAWHPAVDRVMPIALRRFKKAPGALLKKGLWRGWLRDLRTEHYDLVIDVQGLLKSALLSLCARSRLRAGFDWQSARESWVSVFYGRRARVAVDQHAIIRNRTLFGSSLGYDHSHCALNYGIAQKILEQGIAHQNLGTSLHLQKPYVVFLHGTTWATKHWPEAYWCRLAVQLAEAGYEIQLLWGSTVEYERALRIAAVTEQARVMPQKLSLSGAAAVLAQAVAIVSVDTGLGHLASALGVPMVSLYGPTDPRRSGIIGEKQISLSAKFHCAPCLRRVCLYAGQEAIDPPCFASLDPDRVWQALSPYLKIIPQVGQVQ